MFPTPATAASPRSRVCDAESSISPDYIQADDGAKYVIGVGRLIARQSIQLKAGTEPDDSAIELQLVLPVSFVEPIGLGSTASAIGQNASIAITDAERTQHLIDATLVGVADEGLASPTGASVVPNIALSRDPSERRTLGVPADEAERYAHASAFFRPVATDDYISSLKDRLTEEGHTGSTVVGQAGMCKTVIDGIVLVLNAFAIIALLAASFGIVNTVFRSVQERTREIGLMEAMGMCDGRVLSLFNVEAAFIGFLSSASGVVIAMLVGASRSSALSGCLLAKLAGLTLIAFDTASIAPIIVVVMAIAFLAGTLPAARAARADPVDSLRYE